MLVGHLVGLVAAVGAALDMLCVEQGASADHEQAALLPPACNSQVTVAVLPCSQALVTMDDRQALQGVATAAGQATSEPPSNNTFPVHISTEFGMPSGAGFEVAINVIPKFAATAAAAEQG